MAVSSFSKNMAQNFPYRRIDPAYHGLMPVDACQHLIVMWDVGGDRSSGPTLHEDRDLDDLLQTVRCLDPPIAAFR